MMIEDKVNPLIEIVERIILRAPLSSLMAESCIEELEELKNEETGDS